MKPRLTAEQALLAYVAEVDAVRAITSQIKTGECVHVVEYQRHNRGQPPESCLALWFAGDESDEKCKDCQRKWDLIQERKLARSKLGISKRNLLIVGRRLVAEAWEKKGRQP